MFQNACSIVMFEVAAYCAITLPAFSSILPTQDIKDQTTFSQQRLLGKNHVWRRHADGNGPRDLCFVSDVLADLPLGSVSLPP